MPARVPPKNREVISNFFGAYFNQDFPDIYGDPEDVIRAFTDEASSDTLRRAADEAEDLARSTDDEAELRQTMIELGIEYMPWADGWDSSHAWLRHLAERFRA